MRKLEHRKQLLKGLSLGVFIISMTLFCKYVLNYTDIVFFITPLSIMYLLDPKIKTCNIK